MSMEHLLEEKRSPFDLNVDHLLEERKRSAHRFDFDLEKRSPFGLDMAAAADMLNEKKRSPFGLDFSSLLGV